MSIDRGIIDQQLQALGETRWWNHRELRDLPAVMMPGEEILAISRGKIGRVRLLRRSWLIVVTDQRLLCLQSAAHSSWRQLEIDAAQINRVALRVGPFRGRVLVFVGGHKYRLLVPKVDAYKLSVAISSIITHGQENLAGFGPTRVVRRVIDHVLALPAAAFSPHGATTVIPKPKPNPNPARDERVEFLEDQVQQLQQQVEFLEELLRQRQTSELSARTTQNPA